MLLGDRTFLDTVFYLNNTLTQTQTQKGKKKKKKEEDRNT